MAYLIRRLLENTASFLRQSLEERPVEELCFPCRRKRGSREQGREGRRRREYFILL